MLYCMQIMPIIMKYVHCRQTDLEIYLTDLQPTYNIHYHFIFALNLVLINCLKASNGNIIG